MGWFGWRETETRGVLVAGRAYDFSDLTRAQVVAFCEAVDAIAGRLRVPFVAVPANVDLSDENSSGGDTAHCSVFAGTLAMTGGTHEPILVTREMMLAALQYARTAPDAVWTEIAAAYRDAGGRAASEDEIVLRLGCTGEMPVAKLAFGQLGARDAALGGLFVHGQAPDQSPHALGVHGVLVAVCSYDSSADPIEMDDEAHRARVEASPNGKYYLIAQHD